MSCHTREEQLNDYVDDLLSASARQELEEHMEVCVACREEVEALRSLREQAASLPRDLEPDRDLWPEIETRLAPTRVMRVEFAARGPLAWLGLRTAWAQWATIAAAAMLLIVASSVITAYFTGALGPAGDPFAGGAGLAQPVSTILTELEPAEVGYARAIEDLIQALDEHRDELDPDTVTAIEANLRVIDRAIRRARTAIEQDPEDPTLARALTDNYRRKLEFLERTNRLIGRS